MGGGTSAAAEEPHRAESGAVWGLTMEHRTDPLGVDSARPRFGWRVRSGIRGQTPSTWAAASRTVPPTPWPTRTAT
ncbi:glycoside hydrolase family 78 protein [Streptomyces sp. NBC_01235]|uniref:glycoside hydrolase family 78 protein n=1 Tax=Streptomyces sp. NBC_01235 TaxID=2903788 RepID=UPI003FA3C1EA